MYCFAQNRERGFTLIELLIAMALALVIITALSSAFVSQRKTYAVQEQVSEMIQGARAAMDMISREVKMAGYNPTGNLQRTDSTTSDFVGVVYDTTQVQIVSDLNGDGETDGSTTDDDANERIAYKYYNTTEYPKQIKRKMGDGTFQPFAENIHSFSFEYNKGDGTASSTSADIRQIKITIEARTAQEDPNYTHPTNGDGYRTYTLTSSVTPPNLDF
jgi:type IV pilus assembly protein PilW